MDDLISRQEAIKLAIDLDCESRGIIKESKCREIENRYNMIPSAQPPMIDEWCDDCKEYDSEKHCCPRWNRVIRQTAEDMKAAQPQQMKGRWMLDNTDFWMCDQCGKWIDILQGDADMNYCPNCGADMREEQDG